MNFGGGKKATFSAGGRKRYRICNSMVMVNAKVKFADGTTHNGLVEIDESSSGELCGMGVFLEGGGVAFHGDDDFFKRVGRTHEEVFPYKYNYAPVELFCSDHHVGADGWN